MNIGQTYSTSDYKLYEETGNKNHFEEVIDKLMFDEYLSPEDKEEVNKYLDTKDKRRAIFISINEKSQFVFNEIEKINDNTSIRDRLKIIIEAINKYIEVGQKEVKKYGEVFTPLNLVDEMLDTLPDEVWSNPNLKWLDPANGIGNFPIRVIPRLMKGLSDWETDVDKRYKHIIENMLYTCDLQPRNVFTYLFLVDPLDEYITNIYTGSFLDEGFDRHMKDVWEVDKFDIVVGNPPYNASQKAKGKRGGGSNLWDKFVIKSISILKESGYLSFVHPTLWRKPQSKRSSSKKVNEIMMNKQIHYLEMHDSNDGMKVFNAGTRYDFYLLENCPIYKKTLINDENRENVELDLRNYDFIPNYNIELFDKLYTNENSVNILYSRGDFGNDKCWTSYEKNKKFYIPIIHSTPKKGVRYMYTNKKNEKYLKPKVIFGETGTDNAIFDVGGKIAHTNGCMSIIVDDDNEGNSVLKAIKTKKFNYFLKSLSYSNYRIEWRIFNHIRKDFYKEFI